MAAAATKNKLLCACENMNAQTPPFFLPHQLPRSALHSSPSGVSPWVAAHDALVENWLREEGEMREKCG